MLVQHVERRVDGLDHVAAHRVAGHGHRRGPAERRLRPPGGRRQVDVPADVLGEGPELPLEQLEVRHLVHLGGVLQHHLRPREGEGEGSERRVEIGGVRWWWWWCLCGGVGWGGVGWLFVTLKKSWYRTPSERRCSEGLAHSSGAVAGATSPRYSVRAKKTMVSECVTARARQRSNNGAANLCKNFSKYKSPFFREVEGA